VTVASPVSQKMRHHKARDTHVAYTVWHPSRTEQGEDVGVKEAWSQVRCRKPHADGQVLALRDACKRREAINNVSSALRFAADARATPGCAARHTDAADVGAHRVRVVLLPLSQ
jgi:hypothetical protein